MAYNVNQLAVFPTQDERQTSQDFNVAVQRFADRFSQIPARWVQELAHLKQERIEFPVWGTLFMPLDEVDIRRIATHLKPIKRNKNERLQEFRDAGWRAVGETGFVAMYFDGELLLGINGAGYDFHEAHWAPLYKTLGYY